MVHNIVAILAILNNLMILFFFLHFQKYNMFLSQIACAAIGVVALSVFGPGWLARSVALAASIGFMVIARANHPPGKLYSICLYILSMM